MTLRYASLFWLLLSTTACVDGDAPKPVKALEVPPPAGAPGTRPSANDPLPSSAPDPAEPGISDLARVARYIYREMNVAESVCPFSNPLHDSLAFAFHVEVFGPHMSQVHLAWAGVRLGEELQPLEEPPAELTAYIKCLAPRLEAVRMDPPPAKGDYQPEYSFPGHRPAP